MFALLGGSAWSLLSDSHGQDLAPDQEGSQEVASVSDPEDEAAEAPEEIEQAPVTDVAPSKAPTPGSIQNNGPTQETGVGQTRSYPRERHGQVGTPTSPTISSGAAVPRAAGRLGPAGSPGAGSLIADVLLRSREPGSHG
jgi:hypothetical protein